MKIDRREIALICIEVVHFTSSVITLLIVYEQRYLMQRRFSYPVNSSGLPAHPKEIPSEVSQTSAPQLRPSHSIECIHIIMIEKSLGD